MHSKKVQNENLFASKESNVFIFFWTPASSTLQVSQWVLVSIFFKRGLVFFNLFLFVSPMSVRAFCHFQSWSTFPEFTSLVVFSSAERIFEKDWQTAQKSILPYHKKQFIKHTVSIFSYTFRFRDHILKILSDLRLIFCLGNVRNVEKNQLLNLRN